MNYLLVEDNDSHAMIIHKALERDPMPCRVDRVSNGEEALAYLRQQGAFATATRPDLILMDLNLPRLDGQEVLKAIHDDPDLRNIIVLVLSTSDAAVDRQRAYANGANGYLVKPPSFKELCELVRAMAEFWGVWNHSAVADDVARA